MSVETLFIRAPRLREVLHKLSASSLAPVYVSKVKRMACLNAADPGTPAVPTAGKWLRLEVVVKPADSPALSTILEAIALETGSPQMRASETSSHSLAANTASARRPFIPPFSI